jgi:hypothetical protein
MSLGCLLGALVEGARLPEEFAPGLRDHGIRPVDQSNGRGLWWGTSCLAYYSTCRLHGERSNAL